MQSIRSLRPFVLAFNSVFSDTRSISLDGRIFFETIIKNPNDPNLGIYYEKTNIPREQPLTVARSVMIRTLEWKMVLRSAEKEELYDLSADPNELNNLIDSSTNTVIKNDLKEQLLRWYLRTSDNSD